MPAISSSINPFPAFLHARRVDLLELQTPLEQEVERLAKSINLARNSTRRYHRHFSEARLTASRHDKLAESLRAVIAKHGDGANVRLKGNHFKLDDDGNSLKYLLHGRRYKLEREAAARFLNIYHKDTEPRVPAAHAEKCMRLRAISNDHLWALQLKYIDSKIDLEIKLVDQWLAEHSLSLVNSALKLLSSSSH